MGPQSLCRPRREPYKDVVRCFLPHGRGTGVEAGGGQPREQALFQWTEGSGSLTDPVGTGSEVVRTEKPQGRQERTLCRVSQGQSPGLGRAGLPARCSLRGAHRPGSAGLLAEHRSMQLWDRGPPTSRPSAGMALCSARPRPLYERLHLPGIEGTPVLKLRTSDLPVPPAMGGPFCFQGSLWLHEVHGEPHLQGRNLTLSGTP